MSFGQGSGLSDYAQGELGGTEVVALTVDQLPAHQHPVAAASVATTKDPADALPARTSGRRSYGTTGDLTMSEAMTAPTGAGAEHANHPPYLVLNWCIAVEGIYPAQP
jgi:microcystin-dependent protein